MINVLRVAFDIDNVICDTHTHILDYLETYYFIELPSIEEQEDYRIEKYFDKNKYPWIDEAVHNAVSFALSRDNCEKINVDYKVVMYLEHLYINLGKSIPFITSRQNHEDTKHFLDNYAVKGAFPYKLHTRNDKTIPSANVKAEQMVEFGYLAIVDDSPEVADVVTLYNKIVLLKDMPYNRKCKNGIRFYEFQSIYNLILALER